MNKLRIFRWNRIYKRMVYIETLPVDMAQKKLRFYFKHNAKAIGVLQ